VQPVPSGEALDSVIVRNPVRLARVARDLGVSLSKLRKLNPQIGSDVTAAGRATVIRYPATPWRSTERLHAILASWDAASKYVQADSTRAYRIGETAGTTTVMRMR